MQPYPKTNDEFNQFMCSSGYLTPSDLIQMICNESNFLGEGTAAKVYRIPETNLALRLDNAGFTKAGWLEFEYVDAFPDSNFGQPLFEKTVLSPIRLGHIQIIKRQYGIRIDVLRSEYLGNSWLKFLLDASDSYYLDLAASLAIVRQKEYSWMGRGDDILYNFGFFLIDIEPAAGINSPVPIFDSCLSIFRGLVPETGFSDNDISKYGMPLFEKIYELSKKAGLNIQDGATHNKMIAREYERFIPDSIMTDHFLKYKN